MFGHDSEPTIVYRYDIMARKEGVPFDEALIRDQLGKSRHFHNLLMDARLKGINAYRDKRRELYPAYDALEKQYKEVDERVKECVKEIKARNAAERRKRATREESAALKKLRAERKVVAAQLREMRLAIKEDETVSVDSDKIRDELETVADQWANINGLYQATKRKTAEAVFKKFATSKEDPTFSRWDGTGRLACQLQHQQNKTPATWAAISLGQRGTELRVSTEGKYTIFHVRVGSSGVDRQPIFARCPVVLHRLWPDDAKVKWVEIICKRDGRGYKRSADPLDCHYQYSICFQLSRAGWTKPCGTGRVAVNPSMGRRLGDSIRVAYWVGDDGARGELFLPMQSPKGDPGSVEYEHQGRILAEIRDRNRNTILAQLTTYVQDWPAEEKPEWISYLHLIKSHTTLIRIVDSWPRHEGDDEIYAALRAWRVKELHLEQWQSGVRRQFERWRKHCFLNFWARMRQQYGEVVVDDTRYADLRAELPADANDNDDAMRRYMNLTAPGLLLRGRNLTNRDKSRVGDLTTRIVSAVDLTRTCHACGKLCDWDQQAELWHTCEHCGNAWDQDRNWCLNALARAKEVYGDPPAKMNEIA